MAYQDAAGYVAGTPRVWQSSGGDYVITCTSLAAGALQQGGKSATLVVAPPNGATAILPDFLQWILQVQMVSAPAAGGEVGLYLGFSNSAVAATNNPAGLTGVDGAGPNVDTLPQLVFAGSVVLSNNLGTGIQRAYLSKTPPQDQYVSPVIYNNGSVALDATALHTILTMVPYYRERET